MTKYDTCVFTVNLVYLAVKCFRVSGIAFAQVRAIVYVDETIQNVNRVFLSSYVNVHSIQVYYTFYATYYWAQAY